MEIIKSDGLTLPDVVKMPWSALKPGDFFIATMQFTQGGVERTASVLMLKRVHSHNRAQYNELWFDIENNACLLRERAGVDDATGERPLVFVGPVTSTDYGEVMPVKPIFTPIAPETNYKAVFALTKDRGFEAIYIARRMPVPIDRFANLHGSVMTAQQIVNFTPFEQFVGPSFQRYLFAERLPDCKFYNQLRLSFKE